MKRKIIQRNKQHLTQLMKRANKIRFSLSEYMGLRNSMSQSKHLTRAKQDKYKHKYLFEETQLTRGMKATKITLKSTGLVVGYLGLMFGDKE